MLRITELKLPLDHAADALRPAICQRLRIADRHLLAFTIFRRGYDARKKSAISLIYTLDCELRDEAAILRQLADDKHVGPTPDTSYRFVAQAPAGRGERRIMSGMGACGLMGGRVRGQ